MSAVLHFEGVSKRYRIGMARRTRRGALSALPTRWAGRAGAGGRGAEYFWSLEDVTFEVTEGRVLGIIGPNGAGKTTVLKLVSRITKPTAGRVRVSGRVSDGAGKRRESLDAGEDVVVQLRYTAAPFVERPHFNIGVLDQGVGRRPHAALGQVAENGNGPHRGTDGIAAT